MIELHDLSFDLGAFSLRHVDLSIRKGEYLVLLGPTGAGKTVLLECIVGLNRRHGGRIIVDGVDVTRRFPEERSIGYVPQDYGLFPHMTVEENLAYGLRARRVPGPAAATKVRSMLERLGIARLAHRYPAGLSGGERQRIAIGRSLVTEPRLLLLDEPLSALDENTRADLAAGLRQIQRSVDGTFLHICHNLEEALDVADRIAIIKDGALVQVGTPDEILYRPSCLFAAEFTRTRNLLPGQAEVVAGGSVVRIDGGPTIRAALPMTGRVIATVRPELVELLSNAEPGPREGELRGKVVRCTARVSHLELEVDIGAPLVMCIGHRQVAKPPSLGRDVRLHIAPEAVHLFPYAMLGASTTTMSARA